MVEKVHVQLSEFLEAGYPNKIGGLNQYAGKHIGV